MIDGFALGPLYIRFYGILLMLGRPGGRLSRDCGDETARATILRWSGTCWST